MADPLDPKGPNTPNPNLTNAVNDLQAGERLLASMESHLRTMAERSDEVSKRFKNVNLELASAVELAENTEEAVKEIAAAAKSLRKGVLDTRQAKDALVTVKAIRDAQEILYKRIKDMPSAQAKVAHGMREMNKWMTTLQNTTGELADDQMMALQRALHGVGKESEQIAKNFKTMSVSHLTRQLTGISGAMKSFGVGKGYTARVEKYSGYADTATKLKEARKARFEGNKDMFREKREKALKAVEKNFGVATADPKSMSMAGRGKQVAMGQNMAKSMGISTKGWKDKDFIGLVRGTSTKAVAGAEGAYHGTGLTGVASKLASGAEGGMGAVAGALSELAPALALLESGIMLLVQVFDGYVAQNKKIEASLGKGGLFQGGGGFSSARRGLTPDSAYSLIGASFDRNLKLAQSITEQGLSIQDIVRGGQEEEDKGMMGAKPQGAAGAGYMAGGVGLIQRAVMGAGRMAGLTDDEGVTRVIKLLGEYRETLQQGENFFIQVGKGAKSAGLSTTKYISIIDQVMGSFDRMNRSLDNTVSLLGQVSKSGRLASEDIEQYFKFLTGGVGGQGAAGSSEQMFIMGQIRKSGGAGKLAANESKTADNLLARAVGGPNATGELAGIPGVSTADISQGFKGNSKQASDFISNTLIPAIDKSGASEIQKKSWNNLASQMLNAKQNSELWSGFSKGKYSEVGTSFGASVGGMDLASSSAMQMQAVRFMTKGRVGEFLANPATFAAQHPEVAPLAKMFQNNPLALKNLTGMQQTASGLRLERAQGVGKEGDEASEALRRELMSSPGIMKRLDKRGIKINFQDPSAFKKYLISDGDKLRSEIGDLSGTFDEWGEAQLKQDSQASEEERRAVRKQASQVSMQTRSTADIFADAFAKWFTNIIEGIEAIIDILPGSNKKEREDLKAQAKREIKMGGSGFEDTTKAIEELGDKAAAQGQLAEYYDDKQNKGGADRARLAMRTFLNEQANIQKSLSGGGFFNRQDFEDFEHSKTFAHTGSAKDMLGNLKKLRDADTAATIASNAASSSSTVIVSTAENRGPVHGATRTGKSSEKSTKSPPTTVVKQSSSPQ